MSTYRVDIQQTSTDGLMSQSSRSTDGTSIEDIPQESAMNRARCNSDPIENLSSSSLATPEWGELDAPKQTRSPRRHSLSKVITQKFLFRGKDDDEDEDERDNNAAFFDVRVLSAKKRTKISNSIKKSKHQRRMMIEVRNQPKSPRKNTQGGGLSSSAPPAPPSPTTPENSRSIVRRNQASAPLRQSLPPLGTSSDEPSQNFQPKMSATRRVRTLLPGYPGFKDAGDTEDHALEQGDIFEGSKRVSPTEFKEHVRDGDELYLKVFRPISLKEARRMVDKAYDSDNMGFSSSDENSDDESVDFFNSATSPSIRSPRSTAKNVASSICGWRKCYALPVGDILITKAEKCKCLIATKSEKFKKWIIFPTEEERLDFEDLISSLQHKIRAWHQKHLEEELRVSNKSKEGPVNLLVEIVSARGLRNADIGGKSDPFVEVRLGNRVLHKTNRIDNTLDPIWTVDTHSMFLIHNSMEDFFHSGYGVTFKVIDYDFCGKNTLLGHVTVPQKVLLDGKGSRLDFPLEEVKSRRKDAGILTIRCRQATRKDLKFMAKINVEKNMMKRRGVANQSEFIKPVRPPSVIGRQMTKRTNEGGRLLRVRPYPDPERESETMWMTTNEIERTSYEESQRWVEAGSGKQGFLYVEILGCDDLPNMDAGLNKRDKTDAFVTAIFEDAIVSTDVVYDTLSPRFLPWTRRAFVFSISHPWSPLLLGVHDYDSGSLNDHDAIGRVEVDLANFVANTEYILHYDLYNSASVPDRKKFGTITIRLSVEYNDIRQLYRDSVSFPSRFHVNVQEKKDFRVAKFVVDGGKDITKYKIETIMMHVEELATCAHVVFYIYNALVFIYEWKGHIPMRWQWPWSKTGEVEILLPLHSWIAFFAAVMLVERPTLAPAIFTACIGWFMLAMLELKTSRASPWARPPTYTETIKALAKGEFTPQTISAVERCLEDEIQVNAQKEKRDGQMKHLQELYDDKMKEWEIMAEFMGESGDVETIESKSSGGIGFSALPLRSVLYPYQVWFAQLCQMKRTIESVLTWDSYILAFCITTASLGLGVLFLFIPWGFLTLWTARFIAWIILGPWRMIAEKLELIKSEMTIKELRKRMKDAKARKKEAFEKEMEALQIQKESALKLAAMKKSIFGNFIVSCPCPMVKVDRYHDMPLPQSLATPIPPEKSMASRVNKKTKTRLQGQKLFGNMVPENIDAHLDLPDYDRMNSNSDIMSLIKESNKPHTSTSAKLITGVKATMKLKKMKKQIESSQ